MEVDALFREPSWPAYLRAALFAFGTNRFPALRYQIEDLVNQTLADLWRYLKRAPHVVAPIVPGTDPGIATPERDALTRIAFAIMKRRAADRYRHAAVEWAATQKLAGSADREDNALLDATAPRRVLLRQMLRICIAELSHASTEERDLLWAAIGLGEGRVRTLNDAERQRLSRLRRRIAAAIARELGDSVRALLASELR